MCVGDLCWWFVLVICVGDLCWWFVLVICVGDLCWWSVLVICVGDLFLWFVLVICSDDLFRWFILVICFSSVPMDDYCVSCHTILVFFPCVVVVVVCRVCQCPNSSYAENKCNNWIAKSVSDLPTWSLTPFAFHPLVLSLLRDGMRHLSLKYTYQLWIGFPLL